MRVLKDSALQETFDRQGYVEIPFLSKEEVETLKKAYFDTLHEREGCLQAENSDYDIKSEITYDFSFIDKSTEYKTHVFQIVSDMFLDKANEYLDDYKPIIANFINKTKDWGEVPIHQNWANVDETKYTSVSVWVPLMDSTVENGTLEVIPGSHKRFAPVRGPMIPWELKDIKEELISDFMVPLEAKAGSAVILDDSIVHYSNINETDGLRLTIQLIMLPSSLSPRFHHYDHRVDPENIDIFEVNQEFYMSCHPWKIPQGGKLIEKVPFVPNFLDVEGFKARMKEPHIGLNPIKDEGFLPIADTKETIPIPKEKSMNEKANKKPLFNRPELQKQFEDDGFAIIPLLSESDVKELKSYYDKLDNDHIPSYGFHVSMDKKDPEFVKGVVTKIQEVVLPKLQSELSDCQFFTASYVVKESNPHSVVPPHQDWTFVDEKKYDSATVWIPLEDVNFDNGALGIIYGSHKFFDYVRCSPSPQAKSPISDHAFTLFPYMQVKEIKAGTAFIFNNKTIHASPPNTSDRPRVAVGLGITQGEAELFHHYLVPGSEPPQTEKYSIDPSFFYTHNNGMLSEMYNEGKKPSNQEVAEICDHDFKKFTADEILEMIKSRPENVMNVELVEKLAKLFNYNLDGSKKQEPVPEKKEQPEVVAVAEEKIITEPVSTNVAPPTVDVQEKEPKIVERKGIWEKVVSIFRG